MKAGLFPAVLTLFVLAVLLGCGSDDNIVGGSNGSRSDFVGTWNQQGLEGGVTKSLWKFRSNGMWEWDFTVEHASAVAGVPVVSATVKIFGTYDTSGSSYTLVFDEVDVVEVNPPTAFAESQVKASLLGIRKGQTAVGQWERKGKTLILVPAGGVAITLIHA